MISSTGITSESLINELSRHSESHALLTEAQSVIQECGLSALEVRFEPTRTKFNAEQDRNIIRIKPGLTNAENLYYLIFELTNLVQHKTHLGIWYGAQTGFYKSAEEYARTKEFIEFNGLKRAKGIVQAINKRINLPIMNKWENIPIENMEFNHYYSTFLADSHKEVHRQDWRNLKVINPYLLVLRSFGISFSIVASGLRALTFFSPDSHLDKLFTVSSSAGLGCLALYGAILCYEGKPKPLIQAVFSKAMSYLRSA